MKSTIFTCFVLFLAVILSSCDAGLFEPEQPASLTGNWIVKRSNETLVPFSLSLSENGDAISGTAAINSYQYQVAGTRSKSGNVFLNLSSSQGQVLMTSHGKLIGYGLLILNIGSLAIEFERD